MRRVYNSLLSVIKDTHDHCFAFGFKPAKLDGPGTGRGWITKENVKNNPNLD